MAKPHGSENRQRRGILTGRFNDLEKRALKTMIENTGLSFAELVRIKILNAPSVRAARQPPVNRQALAHFAGQLGKFGSNLNQIARQANMTGEIRNQELLEEACHALLDMRTGVMEALGRERPPIDDDPLL